LLIGLAYKKNIDDMRESPSLKLMELLEKRGALVDYHDPFIIEIPITREYAEFSGRRSQVVNAATIAAYDAVLVSTDHDNIDWPTVVANSKIVIDTRNVCQRKGLMAPNVVKA
jgi:UDP-N-acetyl-D-glucosamine dehydrogenase